MKIKILHFIDSLGNGGAEHLLVNVVNNLDEKFENYIVTFKEVPGNLNDRLKNAQVVNLNLPLSYKNFLKIRTKLNALILNEQIDVVHSHSYWTNFVARFLIQNNKTKKIIFFQSYHNAVYETLWHDQKVKMLCVLDRLTLKKSYQYIAVSDYVKSILLKRLRLTKVVILKNFIEKSFSSSKIKNDRVADTPLKIVSIGSFKKEKNLLFAINELSTIKDLDIEYYIYGDGGLRKSLENLIAELNLKNVFLMGVTENVLEELQKYNVFLMPSISEACPLSPLEAMTVGLPLLLADIPPLREIAQEKAVYFNPFMKGSLTEVLEKIYHTNTSSFVDKEYDEILQRYSKTHYISELEKLYTN